MSTETDHIKQLNHIRQLLTHPAIDQQDILRRVRRVFKDIHYFRHPYTFNMPMLFRAAAKQHEDWFNDESGNPIVSKLHCPPDAAATLQRCNWAGDPVFYCSTENGVPIFEVRAALDQIVVVSTWVDMRNNGQEPHYPVSIMGLAIGVKKLVTSLNDDDPLKALLLQDDIFKANTPLAIKEVDAYIGELFTENVGTDKSLYLFTSAIARTILHDLHQVDSGATLPGFIYPSVESKFSGHNVVFNKDFARLHLKLSGAVMYEVVEYDPDQASYSLKTLKGLANNPIDGSPMWKNIHSRYDAERFHLDPQTQTLPPDPATFLSYEDE